MANKSPREFRYIQCVEFWFEAEADDLFDFAKGLPRVREDSVYQGKVNGKKRIIGLGSYSISPNTRGQRDGVVNPKSQDIAGAPLIVQSVAAKLTKLNGGKPINYLSFIAYENENDHIDWHQHNEDRCRDATVYIISMGEVRTFGLRRVCEKHRVCDKCSETCHSSRKTLCKPCKEKRRQQRGCPIGCKLIHTHYKPCADCETKPSQWKSIQPEHGSIIVLPDSYNRSHEHAILGKQDQGGDKRPKQLRISINTKNIRPEDLLYVERENRTAMTHGEDGLIPLFKESVRFPVFKTANVKGSTKKNWRHVKGFIDKAEARALYDQLVKRPDWIPNLDHPTQAFAIYYGKSYDKQTSGKSMHGGREGEIPKIPKFLEDLRKRVEKEVECPINYVQCHKYGPDVMVRPHFDPGGTVVPMLTLGQARTFRVGGMYTQWAKNQVDREVEWHVPAETPLMEQGDLLVFDGGQTLHSMYPTNLDPAFKPNKSEWRISIIFRWTTDIMREYGPGESANQAGQKRQYDADRKKWCETNIKPRVYCCRAGHQYPPDAVYIGCLTARFPGTVYGNDYEPFKGHKKWVAHNQKDFRAYAIKKMQDPAFRAQAIKDLRGKHLLCWCVQDGPKRQKFCHARVWLELVNPKHGKVAES